MRDVGELIGTMTLEEKASLCSGLDFWHTKPVERLGIPSVMVTDGPHGLRKQASSGDGPDLQNAVPATCFPSGVGLASTWNRELVREVGAAIGREARAEAVAVVLGPAVNIKRSPLCGRNFEYFSEDPYLAGELATAHILGVQDEGVGTSIKHFAANNQETRRMTVDARVDERTLREIYLPGFEVAVKHASPWTVMCAYNRLNGTYCAENEWLLSRVLKDEWGHEGIVVTDWGANNDRVAGLLAGQELEMPGNGGINDAKIVAAVREGRLPEDVLDRAVERLLRLVEKAEATRARASAPGPDLHADNHRLARRVAAESFVLLKNDRSLLPLERPGRVAFLGAFAEHPRYQGGGSSHIRPTRIDSALTEARAIVDREVSIEYAPGYRVDTDEVDAALVREAAALAARSEVAVVFAGLIDAYESEGFDRRHLRMPESHLALIDAVLAVQPNTVVVLSNGAPVEMPWIDRCPAVLETYLGGQAWGGAVADAIFGRVNPSGKLAETFPVRLEDNPSYLDFPGDARSARYAEGIYVGYRWYDARRLEPLFPFGHGLSYTGFRYDEASVSSSSIRDDEPLEVRVPVTNTGSRHGAEVVQLYVAPPAGEALRPPQELKGFQKVALDPGQSATVRFRLSRRSFAHWDAELGDWRVEAGRYELRVGSSSRDVRTTVAVTVTPANPRVRRYDANTPLGVLMEDPRTRERARELYQGMFASMGELEPGSAEALMMAALVRELPLRNLVTMSGGRLLTEQGLAELIE